MRERDGGHRHDITYEHNFISLFNLTCACLPPVRCIFLFEEEILALAGWDNLAGVLSRLDLASSIQSVRVSTNVDSIDGGEGGTRRMQLPLVLVERHHHHQ